LNDILKVHFEGQWYIYIITFSQPFNITSHYTFSSFEI